jgi:hypothetical protein
MDASGAKTIVDMAHEFRLAEYQALRQEIIYEIQAIDTLKVWISAIFAGYYSLLFSKFLEVKNGKLILSGPLWAWVLPIIFPLGAMFRLWLHMKQLYIFSDYIKTIEQRYAAGDNIVGWQNFYTSEAINPRDKVWMSDYGYFIVLFIFACSVAGFRWWNKKEVPN